MSYVERGTLGQFIRTAELLILFSADLSANDLLGVVVSTMNGAAWCGHLGRIRGDLVLIRSHDSRHCRMIELTLCV